MPQAEGTPWDVKGLDQDVGQLLGELSGENSAVPLATPPSFLPEVQKCRNAVASARATIALAHTVDDERMTPVTEAWLGLMDELLTFGETMTNVLLERAS